VVSFFSSSTLNHESPMQEVLIKPPALSEGAGDCVVHSFLRPAGSELNTTTRKLQNKNSHPVYRYYNKLRSLPVLPCRVMLAVCCSSTSASCHCHVGPRALSVAGHALFTCRACNCPLSRPSDRYSESDRSTVTASDRSRTQSCHTVDVKQKTAGERCESPLRGPGGHTHTHTP
jgi:hypothetical protein